MKIRPLRSVFLFVCAVLLSACVTTEYMPPEHLGLSTDQTSRIVDHQLESVWQKIETFAGSLPFAVDTISREARTISGTFTASPDRYLDGGQLVASGGKNSQAFTEYMLKKNLLLRGIVDVSLAEVDAGTRISVNVQYTVEVPGEIFENPFTGEVVSNKPTTWSFESGGSDTQPIAGDANGGNQPEKTFTANGVFETHILNELAGFLH